MSIIIQIAIIYWLFPLQFKLAFLKKRIIKDISDNCVQYKMLRPKTSISQGKKEVSWKGKVHTSAAANETINSFAITMKSLREMAEKEAKLVRCALKDIENNLIDPKHILELTKSIHSTGEKSISEYIKRNTEILLNEHASVIRQQVIKNMKLQMQEMSDELTRSTQKLENNISNFFELIESSYESASDSFHKVVNLSEENYMKEELINKTKNELFSIQSEVQQLEEQLLECLMCYAFLDTLFPNAQRGKTLNLPEDFLKSFGPSYSPERKNQIQRKVLEDIILSGGNLEPYEVNVESAEEITKVIERLKDSNLSLVRNSHLSKSSLTFERQKLQEAKKSMEEDLKSYDVEISAVEAEIEKTKEVKERLEKQLKDMQEDQTVKESLLEKENEMKKLAELYSLCTGSDAKNVDIFLMKAAIDYCLEDLFRELNQHPKRKIREMLRILESEKKLMERKLEEALRAERLQKRLQRDARYAGKFF